MITKIIKAEIKDGKLSIENVNPDDVQIIGQGEKDSFGFVLFGDENCIYIANTQPDLQETINELAATCDEMATLCQTSIGAGTNTIDKPFIAQAEKFQSISSKLKDMELI